MKIGEVSKLLKINSSAIRYYENEKLMPSVYRRGGVRVFNSDDVLRLKIIIRAQELGFSIKEIKSLMSAFKDKLRPKAWDKMAITKIEELEEQIIKSKKMLTLLKAGLNCDCVELSSCSKLV